MTRENRFRDTGIEWLSKIPEHWELIRLRFLCDITTGKRDTIDREDDGEFPFFVRSKKIERISSYSYDGEAILTAGDGDICKIWHHVNEKFDFHQRVYMLYNFKHVYGRFLYYFLSENFVHEVFKLSAKNTVDSLRLPMFLDFPVAVPPMDEQILIANYLDAHLQVVDELIGNKEKLIQLLEEKKQSNIFEAITKGLNEQVVLKDSGVNWLGKVPDKWSLKRLKFVFRIKKEIAGKLGYNVLSVTQKGIKVRDLENLKGQLSMDYTKYQVVEPGDFIMNHMDLLTGYVDISKELGVTSPDYRVFTLIDKECDSRYYLYLFQFCYYNKIFYGLGQGVSQLGRWRLPAEQFNNFLLPCPALKEQQQIVQFIEELLKSTNELIEKEEMVLEKLREHRQSIVSEAVSGKVDLGDCQLPMQKQYA